MRPSNQYDRSEEKPTDSEPRQRSRVRVETPDGAVDETVTHLPRATTDAVIDMARQAAGVAPSRFSSGTVIPMTAPDPYDPVAQPGLVADGGPSVVEIDVPKPESSGSHYHAPGTPCSNYDTRRSHMAAFALANSDLTPCQNCVAVHGLDDVVTTVANATGDDDERLIADGGREVVELPVTLHSDGTGLFMWVGDDDTPDAYVDGATIDGGIEWIERQVFARLPEAALDAADRELLTEDRRTARGRDAPQVAVVEYYPESNETGGVALEFDRLAYVTLFPTPDEEKRLVADGGTETVTVRSGVTTEAFLQAAQRDPDAPALDISVAPETITVTGRPDALAWLSEWFDARASARDACSTPIADIAAGMADRIHNQVDHNGAGGARERLVSDGGSGHADAVLAQLRQAERDGDLPDEIAAEYDLDDGGRDE